MVKKGEKSMTNEEHIKSMNIKQLAKFLQRFDCRFCPANTPICECYDKYLHCKNNIKKWLKKEIE